MIKTLRVLLSNRKTSGRHYINSPGVLFYIVLFLPWLGGCAVDGHRVTNHEAADTITVQSGQTWRLTDLDNRTGVLTASQITSTLLQTHLLSRDIEADRTRANASSVDDSYAIEGEVLQWHYQHGAALRPRVSIRLDVRDVQRDRVVRSDTLSDVGSRGESISMLADTMLRNYVLSLPLSKRLAPMPVKGQLAATSSASYLDSIGSPAGVVSSPLAIRRSASADQTSGVFNTVKVPDSLAGRAVAFYYGATLPLDELSQFDRLILEADNVAAEQLRSLTDNGAKAYAYLSVGEVGKSRSYANQLEPSWILGTNPVWESEVLDLSSVQLRSFLVQRVGELVERGYHGVFLDTMDSFHIVTTSDDEKLRQRAGLVSLVQEFARAYPQLNIITNRGFEVLDDIAEHVEAVVAESLYSAWNNESQRYVSVSEQDRQWLLSKLDHVASQLDLDVIVVDYVAPNERDTARDVAARIAQHGFIPWVANPALDYLGVGAMEVVPRKVLMLYDGAMQGAIEDSFVHRYIAMPVEYLGYVPEYLDVSAEPLPEGILKGRYAGIVTWAQAPFSLPQFRPWLYRQMDDGVPVAFFGTPPLLMESRLAKLMGVSSGALPEASSATLTHSDDMIKPERSLSVRVDGFSVALRNSQPDNTVHMRYRDARGVEADVVLTGTFGGYALSPGAVQNGLDDSTYWVVDPFRFIETALKLPRVPQPDVTTENGRRLWLGHIDGDALPSWAEMPGRRLGAEVLHDEILTRYPLPHTVSVVEAEMTSIAAYADRRQQMFDITRRIFKLDNVEIASHTYSHPFYWSELGEYRAAGKYNLPVSGYRFSAEREVAGSTNFIDRQLAPEGKRTRVMLWSGDALPRAEDLAVADRLGLPNMNGGFTAITRDRATVSRVGAMARPVGDQLQVYAPIMNENIYTDDWLGPFDGFRHVIDTFKMTDKPRRLKPINVYYHFYSGTKTSSLQALREVYDWSSAQDIFPLYVSDYARKVPDFRRVGVARYLDGRWKVSRLGNIRSLRILGNSVFPSLADSKGIAGSRALHDAVYVHTDGSDKLSFIASTNSSEQPHLVSSNGEIRHWRLSATGLEFRITGEVPVSVELGGAVDAGCVLNTLAGPLLGKRQADGSLLFTFTQQDTGDVTLNCPA